MKLIGFVLLLALAEQAVAYPEMVRHGYIHCTACHTSQVGGGLLNEYGRALSRELLSQLSLGGKPTQDGDEDFLYGLAKTSDKYLFGGDIRVLQLFVDSPQASRGRFFVMQVDLDASIQMTKKIRTFLSVGRVEPQDPDPTAKDFVASPRHGVEFTLTSPENVNQWTLRVGRFMPAYGIAFAEHTFVTRQNLAFLPGQERYAAELAWVNDRSMLIATGIFKRAFGNDLDREEGGAIQFGTAIGKGSKIGINAYQTELYKNNQRASKKMYGLFAHMGFSKQWYGLLEIDRPVDMDGNWGLVEIFKLGYEVHQGWHLVGVQEYSNPNSENANPKFEAFSMGTQWFPRPHWDLYGLYRKERDTRTSNDFQDVVWLIAHFYL